MTIKLCAVTPDICGCYVRNLLHVTCLVPRILREFVDFMEAFSTPALLVSVCHSASSAVSLQKGINFRIVLVIWIRICYMCRDVPAIVT